MIDAPRDPELETLLELLGEQIAYGIRTHLPGMITSYDATKQRASVKPLIKDGEIDELNNRRARSLPEINDAIVMFAGPKDGRWTYPVAKGDLCLISFCSSSIELWRQRGGEVDPNDDRRHDISDAVVFVGLHNFLDVPTTAPLDAVVLHSLITIKLGGPTAAQSVLRGEAFLDALSTLVSAIATAVGGGGGTAIESALTAFENAAGTYKSGKVKIE